MILEIDPESGVPIYVQIVDRITEMLLGGKLSPGQQLPTIRQLATDLRINYNTVSRAYALLDDQGVISTQQGRGTYITSRLSAEQVREMRRKKLTGMMEQTIQHALAQGYTAAEIEQAFDDGRALFRAGPEESKQQ